MHSLRIANHMPQSTSGQEGSNTKIEALCKLYLFYRNGSTFGKNFKNLAYERRKISQPLTSDQSINEAKGIEGEAKSRSERSLDERENSEHETLNTEVIPHEYPILIEKAYDKTNTGLRLIRIYFEYQ